MTLRSSLAKLAFENPELRKHLVPLLNRTATDKEAMEFPTQEALKKYLKEHPDADKRNHKVVPGGAAKPVRPSTPRGYYAEMKKVIEDSNLDLEEADDELHDVVQQIGSGYVPKSKTLKDAISGLSLWMSDAKAEGDRNTHATLKKLHKALSQFKEDADNGAFGVDLR